MDLQKNYYKKITKKIFQRPSHNGVFLAVLVNIGEKNLLSYICGFGVCLRTFQAPFKAVIRKNLCGVYLWIFRAVIKKIFSKTLRVIIVDYFRSYRSRALISWIKKNIFQGPQIIVNFFKNTFFIFFVDLKTT